MSLRPDEIIARLTLAHALELAAKRIRGTLPKGAALEPGGAGFDCTVQLRGDLVIDNATPPGKPETVCLAKERSVLASLIAEMGEAEAMNAISEAVGSVKKAETSGVDQKKLESHLSQLDELLLRAGKRRKFTTEKRSPGKRGSVRGKPMVRVESAQIEGREMKIEIEPGG